MLRLLLTVLLIGMLPGVLFAQTGKTVSLEWKFNEGEKFWVDTQTRVEQAERTNTQSGANIVLVRTITSYLVKKVTEANYVELEAKIESSRYQNNQTLDSEKMSALYGRLQGATFKITLSPQREVLKLEGYAEWLNQLGAIVPQAEIDRIRILIPEADLRNAVSEGFSFLPDKPVSLNGQWKKKTEMNLAPAGMLTCMINYAYKGADNKGREKILIDCKEQGKFTPSPGMASVGSQTEFIMEQRTGTIYFNNKIGKLDNAEQTYQTRGTILVPATLNAPQTILHVINKIQVKQTLSAKAPTK